MRVEIQTEHRRASVEGEGTVADDALELLLDAMLACGWHPSSVHRAVLARADEIEEALANQEADDAAE